jgi:hypothetical protein
MKQNRPPVFTMLTVGITTTSVIHNKKSSTQLLILLPAGSAERLNQIKTILRTSLLVGPQLLEIRDLRVDPWIGMILQVKTQMPEQQREMDMEMKLALMVVDEV